MTHPFTVIDVKREEGLVYLYLAEPKDKEPRKSIGLSLTPEQARELAYGLLKLAKEAEEYSNPPKLN